MDFWGLKGYLPLSRRATDCVSERNRTAVRTLAYAVSLYVHQTKM